MMSWQDTPVSARPCWHARVGTPVSARPCWRPPPRVSQVPRRFFPRPPSPTTPESPTAARARCLAVGARLHPSRQAGHSHWSNEAESGSLTLRLTCMSPRASRTRIAPKRADSTTWRASNYHGQYLATNKNRQASPDTPRMTGACKVFCFQCSTLTQLTTDKPSAPLYVPAGLFQSGRLGSKTLGHLLVAQVLIHRCGHGPSHGSHNAGRRSTHSHLLRAYPKTDGDWLILRSPPNIVPFSKPPAEQNVPVPFSGTVFG